jgi:hypothetical protein
VYLELPSKTFSIKNDPFSPRTGDKINTRMIHDIDRDEIKKVKVLNIPFDDFWNLYDKKVGKDGIEKKWESLTNKDRIAVMDYLPRYILSTPDKMFRKHPKTFLNNKSWNDEIIGKPIFKPVYGDLLRDPRWQRKKSEILQRDDFTCQLCADTETELQVHHKKYTGLKPWEYDDKELITLCITCHKKIS